MGMKSQVTNGQLGGANLSSFSPVSGWYMLKQTSKQSKQTTKQNKQQNKQTNKQASRFWEQFLFSCLSSTDGKSKAIGNTQKITKFNQAFKQTHFWKAKDQCIDIKNINNNLQAFNFNELLFSVLLSALGMCGDFHTCATRTVEVGNSVDYLRYQCH